MATIGENLASLVSLQTEILNKLEDKGATLPSNACLASVPQLISSLPTNSGDGSLNPDQGISKCGSLLTRFAIFSDIHMKSPTEDEAWASNRGYIKGKLAFNVFANESLDFVTFCGDSLLAEGGNESIYSGLLTVFDELRSMIPGKPLYMIPGNHDSGCDISVWESVAKTSEWTGVTYGTDSCKFYKEINGDLYIWFGKWNSKTFDYLTFEYGWLFDLLDANKDRKRIFLFTHWYDGTVDGFGWRHLSGTHTNNGMQIGSSSAFGRIKDYKNVIWFSGHSHTDWEYEDTYPTVKVHSNNTARMISIPSMYTNGQFAIVSVYDNMVVVEPYKKDSVRMANKTYYFPNLEGYSGSGSGGDTPSVTYYSISNSLVGVSTSNSTSSIENGSSYSATLSYLSGYSNMSVTITMGGNDITSTAYNSTNNTISISSVTGNIAISATAVSASVPDDTDSTWADLSDTYPTYVKMVYDVTDISSPTEIMCNGRGTVSAYKTSYISDMIVDGEQVTPALTYQFSTIGKHVVYLKFSDNKFHTGFAYGVPDLYATSIPTNIVSTSASIYKACPKLKYIKFDMTLGTSVMVDNVIDDAESLDTIIFGVGVPGATGSHFLQNTPNVKHIYIYGDSFTVTNSVPATSDWTIHVKSGIDTTAIRSKFANATIVADL